MSSLEEKRGLWDNIWAKRKRIAAGSGERMRKPGSKGAPSAADLKASQVKEDSEAHSTNKNKPSSRFEGSKELSKVYKSDTPGQSKVSKIVKEAILEALNDCPCNGNCKCEKPKKIEEKKEHQNPSGGLSQKGRDHYNRTTGSNLKAPVTTEPSKLKKGGKAYSRRKRFCARMDGMKEKRTSAETARDPDSRINKALRKWNC
jgi:hypothetical protein